MKCKKKPEDYLISWDDWIMASFVHLRVPYLYYLLLFFFFLVSTWFRMRISEPWRNYVGARIIFFFSFSFFFAYFTIGYKYNGYFTGSVEWIKIIGGAEGAYRKVGQNCYVCQSKNLSDTLVILSCDRYFADRFQLVCKVVAGADMHICIHEMIITCYIFYLLVIFVFIYAE